MHMDPWVRTIDTFLTHQMIVHTGMTPSEHHSSQIRKMFCIAMGDDDAMMMSLRKINVKTRQQRTTRTNIDGF